MARRRHILTDPGQPAPHRADSEAIVRAIVAAASDLGPHATLAEIAARAGVGTASLHRYFPSTAAIFAEVSRQTYRTLLDQVRSLTDRDDLPLREMIQEMCAIALAGPGLSLEHRRRLHLEIPLVWSVNVAEPVYGEIVERVSGWIRRNVHPPPSDLEARLFVAVSTLRGCTAVELLHPGLTPDRDVLLPVVADAIHRILTAPRHVERT